MTGTTEKKSGVFGASLAKGGKAGNKTLNLKQVDDVAAEQGFVSREAQQRRNYVGPTRALNTKLPVDVYERFAKFCDDENLTIRKAIEKLLDTAGV